jgi:parallel beta-helix repeat protein
MLKKFAVAAAVAAMLAAVFTPTPAMAATVTVSGGGDELADAVRDASDGDIINVETGTYTKRVKVRDMIGLTIQASNMACHAIDDETSDCPVMHVPIDDAAFRVRESSNITIKGFTITRGDYGVRARQAPGIDIQFNDIAAAVEEGIRVRRQSDGATINGNIIEGEPTAASGRGIRVKRCSNVTVTNNTVTNKPREGLRARRITGTLTVTGGEYSNNGRSGLRLGGNNVTVTGVTASDNARSGIRVRASSATVTGNTANDNGRYGIRVRAASATVENNTATGNTSSPQIRVNGQNGN